MNNPKQKQDISVIIFELGGLVCYALQTPDEVIARAPYKSIYWKDKIIDTQGPFESIHQAMKHYTWSLENRKVVNMKTKQAEVTKKLSLVGIVIPVDFVAKRRI